MSKIRILVAEDDKHIRQGLLDLLEAEGYEAVGAADGKQALSHLESQPFGLAILDIMMPERSGYDVCRELRRKNQALPVIMLTAKAEEIDKVLGLQLGADDYVTKRFGARVLLARIEAVLRRTRRATAEGAPALPDVFAFGPAEVSRKTYQLRLGRKAHDLTAQEMRLLETFAVHPGEVLDRDALLNAAWGVDYFGTTRTLDQHVVQLRKKVEADPARPKVILTVHGVGYRYQP